VTHPYAQTPTIDEGHVAGSGNMGSRLGSGGNMSRRQREITDKEEGEIEDFFVSYGGSHLRSGLGLANLP
jgi:hypothetical protein